MWDCGSKLVSLEGWLICQLHTQKVCRPCAGHGAGLRDSCRAGQGIGPFWSAFDRRLPPNHHPALHYGRVGWAIAKVRESTSSPLTKPAFEFFVLTAARSGEVRKANWGEILWDRRTWESPTSG